MSHPLPYPNIVSLIDVLANGDGGSLILHRHVFDDGEVMFQAHFEHWSGAEGGGMSSSSIEVAAEYARNELVKKGAIDDTKYPVFTEILTVTDAAHREVINGQNYGVCRKCGRPITVPDETLEFQGTNDIYDCCSHCAKILTYILVGLENNPPRENTDIREIANFAVDVFFTPGSDYNPIEFA